jgi:hypothetical protein
MPRPLMKRLGEEYGHKTVLEFVKKYGRGEAQRKFGVKDCLCFGNYLFKLTGDKWFGYFPTDPRPMGDNRWLIRQQLTEAVLRRLDNSETLARLRHENKLLDARIAHLQEKYVGLANTGINLALERI